MLVLKAWQSNMDTQPIFNEYKAVKYMYQYFSKTKDRCSQAMKQAAKEFFDNKMHHHDTMEKIPKSYLRNREFYVEEVVYYNLPELKLKRIFPAAYFVNKNLSEKRANEPPDDSLSIFNKSNIDCCIERLGATFYSVKYTILNDFCYAEISAYYALQNKSAKTGECQPDKLDDNLIEKNHEKSSQLPLPPFHPKNKIDDFRRNNALSKSKVWSHLKCHLPNKILFPETFAYHAMLYQFMLHYVKTSSKSKESRML